MIKNILIVGLGGGAGSILRYLASLLVARCGGGTFPWATWAVNITGCLLAGVVFGWWGNATGSTGRLLWLVGFCGGFTTFSAFALENVNLWQAGDYGKVCLYTLVSVGSGLVAVWAGTEIAGTR